MARAGSLTGKKAPCAQPDLPSSVEKRAQLLSDVDVTRLEVTTKDVSGQVKCVQGWLWLTRIRLRNTRVGIIKARNMICRSFLGNLVTSAGEKQYVRMVWLRSYELSTALDVSDLHGDQQSNEVPFSLLVAAWCNISLPVS
jgi:hypothetical protein